MTAEFCRKMSPHAIAFIFYETYSTVKKVIEKTEVFDMLENVSNFLYYLLRKIIKIKFYYINFGKKYNNIN
jgi:hypothetical protein